MLQLTFNPGLTLTGFRTTRPWSFVNFYEQQETEEAYWVLITWSILPSGQLQSFSPNNSVGEDVDYCNS